jgi:hypothetical protein
MAGIEGAVGSHHSVRSTVAREITLRHCAPRTVEATLGMGGGGECAKGFLQ